MSFPDFTRTVPVLVRNAAERFGSREFVVADSERLTYTDVEARSRAVAAGLAAYKVRRHVAVCAKSELPFTESGKIKKRELAEMLAERITS